MMEEKEDRKEGNKEKRRKEGEEERRLDKTRDK